MARLRHVLVVGAGIVGASIAWHLARAGATVTIVDAKAPGGVATRNSWAWINASWGNPEPYFRLRVRAIEEWHRLQRDVPDLHVVWAGGLLWELPAAQLEAFAAEHAAWGYDIHRLDRRAVRRIEPQLAAPPEFALHAPAEGSVEPLAAALALLNAAQALGASLVAHTQVRRLTLAAGRVTGVETNAGRLAADEVVVACGAGTANLVATAGCHVAVAASPALLVVTRPHARCLNGLVMPPKLQVRQTAEGRLVATADVADTDPGADAAQQAATMIAALRGMFVSGAPIAEDYHVVARRPIPHDGFPVVGRTESIPGLYIAVMHSGITLAPMIGRCVADEVLTGQRDRLLMPYGPD